MTDRGSRLHRPALSAGGGVLIAMLEVAVNGLGRGNIAPRFR